MDDASVKQVIVKELSWLQRHERIVLATLVLATILFLGNKFNNWLIQRDNGQVAVAMQQLKDQEAMDKQTAADYKVLVDTQSKQIAALTSAIASREGQLAKQKQVDQTLALPDLAARWKNLSNLGAGEIQATASGVSVSDTGARKTVAQLEELPVVKQDLKDETSIAEKRQAELSKADELISGLRVEGSKKDAACDAKITDLKAKERKSKRNWFIAGSVVTVIAKVALKYFVF